jgi:Arc/MetJ-type ribon-helix-helix transcriptional regulator
MVPKFIWMRRMAKTEQAYQIALRLTKSEYERIEEMIGAGLFRSAADFAREAVRDKLREAEAVSVGNFSARDVERRIDDYLTKNPGSHFASEMAETLGLDLRTTIEAVRRMIESGKIHKSGEPAR